MPKALVVDDAVIVRRAMARMVSRRGFEVAEAVDGPSALAALAADGDVALVLVDCLMPGMTGLDVIAHLRADARHDAVKLVLVTGLDERGAETLSGVNGADAVLLKPFRDSELRALIDRLGLQQAA